VQDSHSISKHQKSLLSATSDRTPSQSTKNRHCHQQAIASQPKTPKTVIVIKEAIPAESYHTGTRLSVACSSVLEYANAIFFITPKST
jgi:hypothetical protein